MDFKELFKFQLLSGSMSNANAPGQMTGKSMLSDPTGMCLQVLFMIAVGFADEITKLLPAIMISIKEKYVTTFLKKQITDKLDKSPIPISASAVPLEKQHYLNTLSMSRVYAAEGKSNDRGEEMNGMIDAVLDAAARLSNVPSFRLIETAQMMISYKDKPIQMTRDIYLRLDSVMVSPEGTVEKVDLTLCSNTVSAADISRHVRHLHNLRKEELKNALGDSIYFFDQKSRDGVPSLRMLTGKDEEQKQNAKQMAIKTAAKQLTFARTPFYSNKRFLNIVGEEVRLIEKRVNFFLNRKDWYDSKGVPYQLGLLLSGTPGTGKTSVIRAIANLTQRHIINVNFSNITTATQLKNLFFSEKLSVYTDASMCDAQSFLIPIDRRIYVLEEIDAVGDIVQQRSGEAKAALPDELTLGEILTVLDGTMESPGRIVIMTSNHPETLDAALIRPGRIDVAVEFGNASLGQIAEMYSSFYEEDLSMSTDSLPVELDQQLSPAEVGQVLFRHFDDPSMKKVIDDLLQTVERKLKKSAPSSMAPSEVGQVTREEGERKEVAIQEVLQKSQDANQQQQVLSEKRSPQEVDEGETSPMSCSLKTVELKQPSNTSGGNQVVSHDESDTQKQARQTRSQQDLIKSVNTDRLKHSLQPIDDKIQYMFDPLNLHTNDTTHYSHIDSKPLYKDIENDKTAANSLDSYFCNSLIKSGPDMRISEIEVN